jgi:hypothetical protein
LVVGLADASGRGASPKLASTVDDHDVRRRYASGTELLADFVSRSERCQAAAIPLLRTLEERCDWLGS